MPTNKQAFKSEFNKLTTQYCRYCNKECHSINSLKQHEVRCKENPDRKDFNRLAEYSIHHRKGKTKETSAEIAKQANILIYFIITFNLKWKI